MLVEDGLRQLIEAQRRPPDLVSGVGLLQITGYTDKPFGVKIRYKLLKLR